MSLGLQRGEEEVDQREEQRIHQGDMEEGGGELLLMQLHNP